MSSNPDNDRSQRTESPTHGADGPDAQTARPERGSNDDRHPTFPGRRRNGQIRKGFSGNRKGRPRKARSTRAVFQEMLQSRVPMMVNGKLKKLTVVEALAARVKREALTGSLRGLEKGVGVAQMYSLPESPQPEGTFNLEALDDEELEIYGRLLHKICGVPWEERPAPSTPPSAPRSTIDETEDF